MSLYTHHSWYTFHAQVYSLQHIFCFYFSSSSAVIIQTKQQFCLQLSHLMSCWLDCGSNKIGHFWDVPKPNCCLGMEKLNLTQQKHTFTNQKNVLQHKKTKAIFSHLLRHPAWKRRGSILVSALHKFVTYLLRHLPTYSPDPHREVTEETVLLTSTAIFYFCTGTGVRVGTETVQVTPLRRTLASSP